MNKYTRKLPKDELKRLAKEISKKLVASDYKNKRVSDPTVIPSDRARGAKKHVKEFLDKAVLKFKEHEKRKAAERDVKASKEGRVQPMPTEESPTRGAEKVDDEVVLTDVEDEASPTSSTSNGKRKREEEEADSANQTPSETPTAKRVKEDDVELPSPPPPPPPPPDAVPNTAMTEEERSMKEQEDALMRENEEAQRLADIAERTKHREEEAALERENEEAMRDFVELTHNQLPTPNTSEEGKPSEPPLNGNGMDLDGREDMSIEHSEARKQEVLSH